MSELFFYIPMAACLVVLMFSLFMLWRNDVVYRARCQALDVISAMCRQDMPEGRLGFDVIDYWYGKFDEYPSYERMMWMFTKWRFADFFPELERLRRAAV